MADPLSAGIGAGISAIGSFASAAIGGHQARKNMRLQAALNYKYSKKSALNSPTWTRQGLTDAGYNPMLAVQNSTSGTNSSWSGLGSQDSPDFSGAISSGIANAQSFKHLENETNTADSTVAMNNANARKSNAEAANSEAENPYIPEKMQSEIGKTQAEIGNINQDTELKSATIDNLKARLELDQYLGEMGIAAQRHSADSAYNATKYHADILQEIANEHSPTGKSMSFRNYMEGISASLHGIGSLLHAGNGRNYSDESIEQTYDKNGNIKGVKTKSKTRKK